MKTFAEPPAAAGPPPTTLTIQPIGIARTPFRDRASAPRQPAAAVGVTGTLELHPDGRFEHALEDLASFQRIWVLFWFHLNDGWKAKVRPPRSDRRRGVFATRSPYRPNPIGMSVLRLTKIERHVLHVSDVDLVDGTPIVDIKPYLPYADAFPDGNHGWLDESTEGGGARDPGPAFEVLFSPLSEAQLAHLEQGEGPDLRARILDVLGAGPSPHPYRRIRRENDGYALAVRDYRVRFAVAGKVVTVDRIVTGYRAREFGKDGSAPPEHRAYVDRFGLDGKGRASGG